MHSYNLNIQKVFTFNINFVSKGKIPSSTSCMTSGTSAPDATLKYCKLFRAAFRFTPYNDEKCETSAGVEQGNSR